MMKIILNVVLPYPLPKEALISKMLSIVEKEVWKHRKKPRDILEKKIESTYNSIKEIGNYEAHVDEIDFSFDLDPYDTLDYETCTKEKFLVHAKERLFTSGIFRFYYPVVRIHGFPSGIKIGHCESTAYNELPKKIQEFFNRYWKNDVSHKPELSFGTHDIFNERKRYLYLKLDIETIGHMRAEEWATVLAEESLHILRFVLQHDVSALDPGVESPIGEHYSGDPILGNYLEREYTTTIGERIESLTPVFVKPGDEISNRIKNAITIFGIATSAGYYSVRLILLCSALEALLLSESDRDYLGWKLAERVSFLTSQGKEKRAVYKDMVRLYRKRSGFVHQKGDTEINDKDVKYLMNLVAAVIYRMVELRQDGYRTLYSRKSDKSIIELIDSMKFDKT